MSSLQELLVLANAANTAQQAAVTENDVTVHTVTNIVAGNPNTKTVLRSVAGRGYTGDREVRYNRLRLADCLAGFVVKAFVPTDGTARTSHVVTALNKSYGLQLDAADFVDKAADLKVSPDFVLEAKALSVKWMDNLNVTLTGDVQNIQAIIRTPTLAGFNYLAAAGIMDGSFYSYAGKENTDLPAAFGSGLGPIDTVYQGMFNQALPDAWVYTAGKKDFNYYGGYKVYGGDNIPANFPVEVKNTQFVNNPNWQKVCIIRLDPAQCQNVSGYLFFYGTPKVV